MITPNKNHIRIGYSDFIIPRLGIGAITWSNPATTQLTFTLSDSENNTLRQVIFKIIN
jgi:hypothetical protein